MARGRLHSVLAVGELNEAVDDWERDGEAWRVAADETSASIRLTAETISVRDPPHDIGWKAEETGLVSSFVSKVGRD